MSTAGWIAGGALLLAVALSIVLLRTRARLAGLEARTARLEVRIDDEVAPVLTSVQVEAQAARATARRAATAAGVDEPPRRLPLEAVTGPVVRVVAFGAGARRTLERLAGPMRARGRTGRAA
jgi:hypothetical protein